MRSVCVCVVYQQLNLSPMCVMGMQPAYSLVEYRTYWPLERGLHRLPIAMIAHHVAYDVRVFNAYCTHLLERTGKLVEDSYHS